MVKKRCGPGQRARQSDRPLIGAAVDERLSARLPLDDPRGLQQLVERKRPLGVGQGKFVEVVEVP